MTEPHNIYRGSRYRTADKVREVKREADKRQEWQSHLRRLRLKKRRGELELDELEGLSPEERDFVNGKGSDYELPRSTKPHGNV